MPDVNMGAVAIVLAVSGLGFAQYMSNRRQQNRQISTRELALRRAGRITGRAAVDDDDNMSAVSSTPLRSAKSSKPKGGALCFNQHKKQSSKASLSQEYGQILEEEDLAVDFSQPM
jgi:hypothetical protein